jgi:hypothetical protein
MGAADKRSFEPGPVSAAHAMFGHECGRCHVNSSAESLTAVAESIAFAPVPDTACTVCHEGPEHHAPLSHREGAKCIDCHREHRDRQQLARVADRQCTVCHADLNRTQREQHRFATSITSWDTHPEFAVLRNGSAVEAPGPEHGVHRVAQQDGGRWHDRARIKLNHAVHLDPRGVLQLDGTRQRLECNACHEPDRASGYMLPVTYEQHCASCHGNQLHFDQTLFPDQSAPHGDAAAVRGALRELYADCLPEDLKQSPEPVLPTMSVPPQGAAWISDRMDGASRILFEQRGAGCRYCHLDVNLVDKQWQVAPARIPDRWLTHSAFRHDSHRMLTCTACHKDVDKSDRTSDVLLPGIATCRSCHEQPGLFRLTSAGRARAECAECHVYHRHELENYDGRLGVDLRMAPSPGTPGEGGGTLREP